MTLPLTGRAFTHAKLWSQTRAAPQVVALDDTGATVDGHALIQAEGTAKLLRQGKLADTLYALSLTTSSATVPVWIWTDFRDDTPAKETLAKDTTARQSYEKQSSAKLQQVTSKITGWLDTRGYTTQYRGLKSPLITADVPIAALGELGKLDGVAKAGIRDPGAPTSGAWFDTIKGTAAHAIVGSAAGQSFCNTEGYQPDSLATLDFPAGALFSSSAPTNAHTRWTTELIAATTGNRVAPGAYTNIGDWGSVSAFSAWEWCLGEQSAPNISMSYRFNDYAADGLTGTDMAMDYYVKHWPFPVVAQAAGNCNDRCDTDCSTQTNKTVAARARNILVVGGSKDQGTTDTSDDTIAMFSPYVNPVTTHGDFELPNIVAPADNIDSASLSGWCGTSGATPQVLGTALLVKQADSTFATWPEMTRATLLATATHPVDGSRTTTVGSTDLKQGAGLLNANMAVTLANSANYVSPNGAYRSAGRYARTLTFATDFNGFYSNDVYNIYAQNTGRLRAVIAWDGTASGCSSIDASGCTGDALDGDIDLVLYKWISGAWSMVCDSASYDSSWELCDVPVTAGEYYQARFILNTASATTTYLGIAWQNYLTSTE